MDILRVTANWTGFVGSPGYTNFFFAAGGGLVSDAQQVVERVEAAFGEVLQEMPQAVRISIEPEVAVLNSDTGMVTDFQAVEPDGVMVGLQPGGYSAASGAVVTWRTNDLRNGRRIRGRTFLVPLSNEAYQSDGTLNSSTINNINQFADRLRGFDLDSELGVWSRPVNGSGGVFATVTSHTVPDMAAVLRSRRD